MGKGRLVIRGANGKRLVLRGAILPERGFPRDDGIVASMSEFSDQRPAGATGIAVGVGSSPNSVRLIRWTHGTALEMRVPWYAFHVDGGAPLGQADRERLEANLELARKLGAQVSAIAGADVAQTLIAATTRCGASMLVVGRSGLSRLGIVPKRATISDRILREASPLDVVVVSDSKESRRDFTFASLRNVFSAPLRQYGLIAAVFAAVTAPCLVLVPALGERFVSLLYLAAILLLSLVSRPGPVVLMAAVSSLAYNFFFIPPRFTFAIASPEDIALFALYFLVAAVTGYLSSGLRSREAMLLKRDRVASLLLAAAERFSALDSVADAAAATADLVARYSGRPSVVYVIQDANRAEAFRVHGADALEEADKAAARLCAHKGEVCGAGTVYSPASSYRFVAAQAGAKPVASIGFASGGKRVRSADDDELFTALGRSLALYIEKEHSEETSRKATLELESERLAKVLFDSVSHELRTPLTTITGSLSALQDEEIAANASARAELLDGALTSARRLNGVVEDFLSVGRMESGRLKLKLEPIDASYLASAIASAEAKSLAGRSFSATLPKGHAEFRLDAALVVRVGINLVENSCRYSRAGGAVELRLSEREGGLALAVRDSGPGFGEERMRAPFVKFKRSDGDQPGGVGLGLAMCRGIAEAHGGRVEARRGESWFEVEAIFPECRTGEAE